MYADIALLAFFAFLYSLISARLASSILTGPMLFVSFGFLIGPSGFDILDWSLNEQIVRILAEWTLALVLFTDAVDANRLTLRRKIGVPERMLLLGLPLAIMLGTVAGWLLFDGLGLYQIAIIATCLAATDAALGRECLHDDAVEKYLRTGLNVESGLNDGLVLPILLVLIGLAGVQSHQDMGFTQIAVILVREIGVGVLVGFGVVAAGVFLMQQATRLGWLDPIWRHMVVVLLAISIFALAQALDGSGFIASFSGGLFFRYLVKRFSHTLLYTAEGGAETMSVLVWILFGTLVLETILPVFDVPMLIYALLSLFVIRTVAVYLCLAGSGESVPAKLYLGWFGPRGLASIVFVVIVNDAHVAEADYIAGVIFTTILISIFLHGLSTHPLSGFWGRADKATKQNQRKG